MRESENYLPDLAFVAEENTQIVGDHFNWRSSLLQPLRIRTS